MPAQQRPTSFICGKEGLTIDGTVFHAGDTVSVAVAKKARNLSALVSTRALIPNVDPHQRKGKIRTPSPITMAGAARRAL